MTFHEIERSVVDKVALSAIAPIHEQSCYQALRFLYADYSRNNISASSATEEKRRIHGVYDFAQTQYETGKKLRDGWTYNVKVSEEFRTKLQKALNSGENIETMFYLACTCIAAMTGDETLAGSKVKTMVEQMKLEV
ncbi:MAG: hypothetical protein RSF73_10095 [Ruthenibacterium sp.]